MKIVFYKRNLSVKTDFATMWSKGHDSLSKFGLFYFKISNPNEFTPNLSNCIA